MYLFTVLFYFILFYFVLIGFISLFSLSLEKQPRPSKFNYFVTSENFSLLCASPSDFVVRMPQDTRHKIKKIRYAKP